MAQLSTKFLVLVYRFDFVMENLKTFIIIIIIITTDLALILKVIDGRKTRIVPPKMEKGGIENCTHFIDEI